jgi:hypothetical protein
VGITSAALIGRLRAGLGGWRVVPDRCGGGACHRWAARRDQSLLVVILGGVVVVNVAAPPMSFSRGWRRVWAVAAAWTNCPPLSLRDRHATIRTSGSRRGPRSERLRVGRRAFENRREEPQPMKARVLPEMISQSATCTADDARPSWRGYLDLAVVVGVLIGTNLLAHFTTAWASVAVVPVAAVALLALARHRGLD